jgi:hypothetical protein
MARADKCVGDLRTTVFDDTTISAVKGLLHGDNEKSIDALKLFSMATNHGRNIDFLPRYMLINV